MSVVGVFTGGVPEKSRINKPHRYHTTEHGIVQSADRHGQTAGSRTCLIDAPAGCKYHNPTTTCHPTVYIPQKNIHTLRQTSSNTSVVTLVHIASSSQHTCTFSVHI